MADRHANPVARYLRRLSGQGASDADLLRRFVGGNDHAAFELLVYRYERLVMGTCLRVLGHPQDAEDAFQATFLVLARKAGAIGRGEAVGGWLYKVAYRAALRARAEAARRPRAGGIDLSSVEAPEAAPAESPWDGWWPQLDEAVNGLPEKYRVPLVLCYLQGKTYEQAAGELGCPKGTVSIRLTRAREMLRRRLARRGLAAPAALLVAASGRRASAGSVQTTIEATAGASGAGAVPARAAALARGVMNMMWATQVKTAIGAALAAGVLAAVAGLLAADVLGQQPGPRPGATPGTALRGVGEKGPQAAPRPAAKAGRLLVWTDTKFVFYSPDGKEAGELPGHPDGRILTRPALSPDGRRVAFLAQDDPPVDAEGLSRHHVFVRTTDGKGDGTKVPVNAATLFWAADGRRLVAAEFNRAKTPKDAGFVTRSIDPVTGKATDLGLPKHALVFAALPGGKGFVGTAFDFERRKMHLARVAADGKVTKLTELRTEGPNPRPSPDGGKVLFQDYDPDEKPGKDDHRLMRLFVFDLKTMRRERLAEVPLNAVVVGYCWSPDGRRIAYVWKQAKPGVPLVENTDNMNDPRLRTETESFLVVAAPDGKAPKTLLTRKASTAPQITLGDLDWR